MGQPVKLSDALILDARLVGKTAERSIAGQIEFWARVGKAVEPLLRGDRALRLKERGDAVPLSRLLATVGTKAGRERLEGHLAGRPFPHFEPAPGRPGLLVRIEADGTRRVGRFVNRVFKVTDRK
jgi:hypothetical protein